MSNQHTFSLDLSWPSDLSTYDNRNRTHKNHTIKSSGKVDLQVSAAKAFKGDPSLHNPEDLLLASLTSCHMMSYLYCCSRHQIEVISYHDHSEAILDVSSDGSGRISEIVLRPIVYISDSGRIEEALLLHQEAHKLCFIANSCNFIIDIQAHVSVKKC